MPSHGTLYAKPQAACQINKRANRGTDIFVMAEKVGLTVIFTICHDLSRFVTICNVMRSYGTVLVCAAIVATHTNGSHSGAV